MTMSTWNNYISRRRKHPTHQQRSVLEDRLPVWSSLGEDDDQNDILELGDRKDGKVLQGSHRILILCAYITSPIPEVITVKYFLHSQECWYCEG